MEILKKDKNSDRSALEFLKSKGENIWDYYREWRQCLNQR
jgi:hypothetical protein